MHFDLGEPIKETKKIDQLIVWKLTIQFYGKTVTIPSLAKCVVPYLKRETTFKKTSKYKRSGYRRGNNIESQQIHTALPST